MSERPNRQAEQLERYWRAVQRGDPPPTDLDPALRRVVERLEGAVDSDGPSATFATRLQGRLEAEARVQVQQQARPARPAAPVRPREQRDWFGWFGGLGEVAAASLVLLLCAGVTIAILSLEGGGGGFGDDDDEAGDAPVGMATATTAGASAATTAAGAATVASQPGTGGPQSTPTTAAAAQPTMAEGSPEAEATPTAAGSQAEPTATTSGGASVAAPTLDAITTRIDLPAGAAPAIVSGAGSAWIAHHAADAIWRVDSTTHQVVAEIGLAGTAVDGGTATMALAFADDRLWAAVPNDRVVHQIDPATNSIALTLPVELPVGVEPAGGASPWSMAVAGGDLWVGSTAGNVVRRMNSEDGATIQDISITAPTGMAVTDDSLWVASTSDSSITRIDLATGTIVATIEVRVETNPVVIDSVSATSTDIWLGVREPIQHELGFFTSLVRIDLDSNAVVWSVRVRLEEEAPALMAVAASDTHIWLVTTGWLTRLDAETTEPEELEIDPPATDPCPDPCVGLTLDGESVWIVYATSPFVMHVEPEP